ncbi:MAG: Uma2 family endonuclease [Ectothiorhodospiraceae bacterium]|jgi:Uma2 family endonuclease|nr:Uma2 family endonuclease [Ectothiorhodospiraceae bacterium]
MGLPLRDNERHTYGDYRQWPDEQRYELIDGIAYAMAPAPARLHQDFQLELARQIADALDGTPCRVYLAPFDVRLPRGNEADDRVDSVVQPDISVVCDRSKLDEHGCRGAPDWIIEVLSPSTASHDQVLKLDLYERRGVREYWLVHPTDRLLTVYLHDGRGYGKPSIHELAGVRASRILPDVVVDWVKLLRRIAD